MTDLELTKMCAEAMGLIPTGCGAHVPLPQHDSAVRVSPGKKANFWYDPLHDDAQAMALVKKLNLCIESPDPYNDAERWHVSTGYSETLSMNADLNRAIVECVAKMQAAA